MHWGYMSINQEGQEETLNSYLKDFEFDEEALSKGNWGEGHPVELELDKLPLPSLVFICLVGLKSFRYWGKSEKVLWEIPVKYKSFPFLLSHRKFGFRVDRKNGVDYPQNIVEEMIQELTNAICAADRLLQPFAQQQIRSGNVTVANHYIKLDMMYCFFRKKAKESFLRPPPEPKVTKRNKDGTPIAWSHDPSKWERQGFYYAVAMIDAFFTRLEHLLVLLLPFIGFDPTTEDLAAIISANWTDKYKRVFNLATDTKAKALFDELKFVKEKYRNAIMHGYFEKRGASLFFHLPPYAVPVLLSGFKDSIQYSFLPITTKSYDDICSLFDEVDLFLKSGLTKYGVCFAESGLGVLFDTQSISRYRAAAASDEDFERFIEHVAYMDTLSVNMDW